MNNKNAIIGMLAGMTGGILIGIGFTSQKGLTLRKRIIEKGDEYLSQILDKLTLNSRGSAQQLQDMEKEIKTLK